MQKSTVLLIFILFILTLFITFNFASGYFNDACKDTDNGIDLLVKGSLSNGSLLYVFMDDNVYRYPATDYCISDLKIFEFHCDNFNNGMAWTCPSGSVCREGECKQNLCNDSDSNLDYTSGENKYLLGSVKIKGVVKGKDICGTGTKKAELTEYYCNGNNYAKKTILCDNGCLNGACKSLPSLCTDSGIVKTTNQNGETLGVYQDYCKSTSTFIDYSCNGNNLSSTQINCLSSGNVCANNKCQRNSDYCKDSDISKYSNDSVIFNKGNITFKYKDETTPRTLVDSCSLSNSKELTEYSCLGKFPESKIITCPEGFSCLDGRCFEDGFHP